MGNVDWRLAAKHPRTVLNGKGGVTRRSTYVRFRSRPVEDSVGGNIQMLWPMVDRVRAILRALPSELRAGTAWFAKSSLVFVQQVHGAAAGNCWSPYHLCSDTCTDSGCSFCGDDHMWYVGKLRRAWYSQDPSCPPQDIRECTECTCYLSPQHAC